MSLTLAEELTEAGLIASVEGDVPDAAVPGYLARLDDELVELHGFEPYPEQVGYRPAGVDRTQWRIHRGRAGTTAASHDAGTAILAAVPAYRSAGDENPPIPFGAGPTGQGATFPASPVTDDRVFHTTRHLEFFWDGTRWLSSVMFREPFPTGLFLEDSGAAYLAVGSAVYDVYVEDFWTSLHVQSTNDGSNHWTAQFAKWDSSTRFDIGSPVSTAAQAPDVWVHHREVINQVLGVGTDAIGVVLTKVGSGGFLYSGAGITYRVVG